jgi:LPXTG-site transpeptidase (sortase) family protein
MIHTPTLRTINKGLFVVLVLLAAYIMAMPLLPAADWWVKHEAPIISNPPKTKVEVPVAHIPTTNMLYIPALDLTQTILEGTSIATVDRGVWRRPATSTPDAASNTVLVGHRFTYNGNGVFYHLDKLKVNDQIIVYWQGKAYEYMVFDVSEVPPTQISIESPTDDPTLTLYTCTPLVTAQNRLVIKARLVES